jgi:SNF2 family DNA or RNA helicase
MESKYYAYFKPPHNVELMNNIKEELSNEYSQDVVKPLLQKIFNNINNNDTDDYLCADKNTYFLILIKFTNVNNVFVKEESIDKTKYTLVSKTIDWNAKKLKVNNLNQFYSCDTNNYYNKARSILFNGSGNNQHINNETQYIFAEYLTIPINYILNLFKDITFLESPTNLHISTQYKKLVEASKESKVLTEPFMMNIITLLIAIFEKEHNFYNFNDLVSSKKIMPYIDECIVNNILNPINNTTTTTKTTINDSKNYIKTIWDEIYKQPEDVNNVFNNHKLIIDNTIKYTSNDFKQIISCNVYSYLYITQKKFSKINYKDALPFRLAFDTNFNYDGSRISNLHNHNRDVDCIMRHNNEILRLNTKIEHLLRTQSSTNNTILRYKDTINFIENEIFNIRPNLLKINKYYEKHLLFNTNTGFKLTFEPELNAYKPLLYLRYMCNNYSRLNNNLLICYDNVTDKRNDIIQFYVSNTLLNDLVTMKVTPDLFTLSRFFTITTEDKYQDGKYKITNHEINKSYEITNKTSQSYKNFCKFLTDTINLNLFEYQKNNLLWMLQLEDNIDAKKVIIESYINKYNININNVHDIKLGIYNLRTYVPEVICKDYFLNVYTGNSDTISNASSNASSNATHKKYIIDIKNDEKLIHTTSITTLLNANNNKNMNSLSYATDFNIIENIITPKEYKNKYIKNIEFCGGAICDEVGLGKTLSIISHLVLKIKHDMFKYSHYKTEMNNLLNVLNTNPTYFDENNNTNEHVLIDPLDKGFEFNNLIIVPSRLTSQWENEIEKYVKNKFNLRAKVLIGINNIKSLEKELHEFKLKQDKLQKLKTNTTTSTTTSTTTTPIEKKILPLKKQIKLKKPFEIVPVIIDTPSIINTIGQITPIQVESTESTDNVTDNVTVKPIKQSKEQKMIAKLMLKAKKQNDKKLENTNSNETIVKPIVKPIEKPITKPISTSISFNTILNNESITETEENETIEETETIEHNVDESVGESVNDSIDSNSDAVDYTYSYLDKYLKCHQSSSKESKACEEDYLSNQLYDIYIVSSNLLTNENYLNYIDHTSDNHLKQHYTGETKHIQQKNKINIIKEFYKESDNKKENKTETKTETKKEKSTEKSTETNTESNTETITIDSSKKEPVYKLCRLTNKFNIFKIKWNRVILDEAHEKLSPTIKMFSSSISKYLNRTKSVTYESQFLYENLCIINSNYKWAMTGTPTEQGIDTIMGLLQFLKVKDYSLDIMSNIDKIRFLSDTIGISPPSLDTLLNTVFKKTYKKDVKTLLNIPLFTEEIIYVEQNNIERNIYNTIRCSRHFSEVVRLRTLFLMCTNILISNEFDVDGECEHNTKDAGAQPEFLTLEQLNTNMISKFTQQLKQLMVNKSKLQKRNTELTGSIQEWLNLCEYICSLELYDCIEPRIYQDIMNKFEDLENNRIRTNCEVFYNILNAFEVWKNPSSIGSILTSNINILRDHLFRIWDTTWNTNQSALIKCSESGAKLGIIKIKDEISKNEKKISSFDTDKTRINNQISLFSNNEFLTDKSKDPCIICFDDLTEIVVTPCRHIFCLTCTKKMSNDLKCNFTCPECRSIIDYKTVNITNIDMINKKDEVIIEDSEGVASEVVSGVPGAVVGPELTELEKKLGKDWKTLCSNKYGSKMCKLVEYLHTLFNDPVNRVIIFSQYDKMLRLIGLTLTEYSIKFVHCTGNNYVLNRNIMKFKKDDSYRVIMLSSENSNSGSTLTEANLIIFCDVLQHDTEQTKAIESQGIGRILRIGQKKNTKIVRFITKGTIEEEHYNNTKYDINILQN